MAIYNAMRDRPSFDPAAAFGLYFRDGEAKPSARAFAFPFVADRRSGNKVLLWGKAPATGKLKIQRERGKNWSTIARIDATRRQGLHEEGEDPRQGQAARRSRRSAKPDLGPRKGLNGLVGFRGRRAGSPGAASWLLDLRSGPWVRIVATGARPDTAW